MKCVMHNLKGRPKYIKIRKFLGVSICSVDDVTVLIPSVAALFNKGVSILKKLLGCVSGRVKQLAI